MNSRVLSKVAIDEISLNDDLSKIEKMDFSSAYSEYKSGSWASIILANQTGDHKNGLSSEYSGSVKVTSIGKSLPHIMQLIRDNFLFSEIKSVRIFKAANYGLIIPHIDYLEFKKGFTRLHVPLKTNKQCFNSELDKVYHMKMGEVWFVDGNLPHSGACLANEERLHLVIDFDPGLPPSNCIIEPKDSIAQTIIERKEFSLLDKKNILSLSSLINPGNFYALLGFLSSIHFSKDVAAQAIYQWLDDISVLSGNDEVMTMSKMCKKKFIGDFDTDMFSLFL